MKLYILNLPGSWGAGGINPVDFRTIVHVIRDKHSSTPGVEICGGCYFDSGRDIWFARKETQLIPLLEKCIF